MTDCTLNNGTIRKLWVSETDAYRDHLQRLDKECRRRRFSHSVSDHFVEEYASHVWDMGGIVYAYLDNDQVRAAAELKKLTDIWGSEAEAAFSVERSFQDQGIGTELMGRVIRAARNRGVQKLYMSCLAENRKMQSIARKYEAELTFSYGEVIGQIVPQEPNYFSIFAEAMEDRTGYFMAVLDIQNRMIKAA